MLIERLIYHLMATVLTLAFGALSFLFGIISIVLTVAGVFSDGTIASILTVVGITFLGIAAYLLFLKRVN